MASSKRKKLSKIIKKNLILFAVLNIATLAVAFVVVTSPPGSFSLIQNQFIHHRFVK